MCYMLCMISANMRIPAVLLLPLLVLLACLSCSTTRTLICTRVVDGNTIILSNGETVRLLGVDTPETKHPRKPVEYYGKEASAFTKKMVEGRPVRLTYDWQDRDKYGRLLWPMCTSLTASSSTLRSSSRDMAMPTHKSRSSTWMSSGSMRKKLGKQRTGCG